MIYDTQSVQISIKSCKSKTGVIYITYMQSWKQCALPAITAMALWQLMHWAHHVPKCMSCHKAIVVITGRAHYFHDCIYMCKTTYTYIHLYIVTSSNFVCRDRTVFYFFSFFNKLYMNKYIATMPINSFWLVRLIYLKFFRNSERMCSLSKR